MQIPSRIAYQTGIVEFGIGEAIAYDAATEIVTVIDEDDGTIWRGPVDLTSQANQKEM